MKDKVLRYEHGFQKPKNHCWYINMALKKKSLRIAPDIKPKFSKMGTKSEIRAQHWN